MKENSKISSKTKWISWTNSTKKPNKMNPSSDFILYNTLFETKNDNKELSAANQKKLLKNIKSITDPDSFEIMYRVILTYFIQHLPESQEKTQITSVYGCSIIEDTSTKLYNLTFDLKQIPSSLAYALLKYTNLNLVHVIEMKNKASRSSN